MQDEYDEYDEYDMPDDQYPCGCCKCCGCTCFDWIEEDDDLTEEELQFYDDNCEEHWERKLQQIQLDQEY